ASNGKLLWQMYGTSSVSLSSNTTLSTGAWYHIAATRSGNTLTIYVNGVADATATYSGTPYTSTDPLTIGYATHHSAGPVKLDEVAVWDKGLSAAEIATLYNSGGGLDASSNSGNYNSANNLKGYWKMDGGSGTSLADSSSNSNTGTLYNMTDADWVDSNASFSGISNFFDIDNSTIGHTKEDGTATTFKVALRATPAPPQPAAAKEHYNKALDFDGSNDYVEVPHNSSLDLKNNFTIEAWVKVNNSSNNTILDKGKYNNLFQTHTSGNSGLSYYDRINGWTYSSGTIPTDTWVHVAVVFKTGTGNLKFYKDGVLLSSHTVNSESPTDSGVMNIGRQSPSTCYCNYMGGSIDELRIWNYVRTQSQIQATMNNPLTGSESGLVAYYNMKDGSGTSLADSSSNSNTATLHNMTDDDWVDGVSFSGSSDFYIIDNISGHTAEDGTTATFKVKLDESPAWPAPAPAYVSGSDFFDIDSISGHTSEDGTTSTFTVKSAPSSNVTVSVISTDTGEAKASVSSSSLTFTPGD
ncbi:MAG: LamG domain-containing protein, partial [Anaerolineales bacterium]|nr:LamG domain-containing protein [Anaerolineales bacterium]